jgi:hypothetical protein
MSSVSSTASTPYASQTGSTASFKQIQSDFQALQSALQSGNVSSAQTAYSALQKDAPELFQSSSSSSTNPLSSALSSLGTALQSGNLSDAQTAMASLTQALKGHHHHHHSSEDSSSAPSETAAPDLLTGASDTDSSTGTNLSAIA